MAEEQYSALTPEEQDAINSRAMWQNVIGQTGQALANQHSAGEYFLGQPRQNIEIDKVDPIQLEKRAMLNKYLSEKPQRLAQEKQDKLDLAKAKIAEVVATEGRALNDKKTMADYNDTIETKRAKLLAGLKAKSEKPDMSTMDAIRAKETFDKADSVKQIKGIADLNNKIDSYYKLLNETGTMDRLSGDKRAKLESALSQAQLAYKTAGDLGALSGPDIGIVGGAIPVTTGWDGLVESFKGNPQARLTQAKKGMANSKALLDKSINATYSHPIFEDQKKAVASMFEPVKQEQTGLSQEDYSALEWAKANPGPQADTIIKHVRSKSQVQK
jgi:hypothetical protein